MTQEDKELLLKDLCGRVPYGVKCKYNDGVIVNTLSVNFFYEQIEGWEKYVNHTLKYDVEDIKPYLFPLSSMTEEQKKEEYEICKEYIIGYESNLIDFYNKYHLDYRGLIPKGLAIDATGLNIY
jgi:hypothetical protein